MKKTMAAVLAMLMAIVMLFSFTACGGDNAANTDNAANNNAANNNAADNNAVADNNVQEPKTIVGKWMCDVEMADVLNQMYASAGITVDSLVARYNYEFDASGTAKAALDEAHLRAQIPGLVDSLVEQEVAAYGMTAADYYAAMNMTREEFIVQTEEQMFSNMGATSMEGTYEVDGNTLKMTTYAGVEEAVSFTLNGDTLTMMPDASMEIPQMMQGLLPLTFTRVG